jgi:3-isopropylmalate/(R)-2-methylmalate dehydratase small subunit
MSKIWQLGDNVDTDQLAPGQYMKFDIATIAAHCLEQSLPTFAAAARAGDLLIAGRNFGCGSSREQAVAVLKRLGIRAVVARSFAGLFYRNAFNLGLLLLQTDRADGLLDARDVQIDARVGTIQFVPGAATAHRAASTNLADATRLTIVCEPVPSFLLDYVDAGGLLPYLQAQRRAAAPAATTLRVS